MTTKRTKGKTITIKGWAYSFFDGNTPEFIANVFTYGSGGEHYDSYIAKEYAGLGYPIEQRRNVIPCLITITLPPKKKEVKP